MTKKLNPDDRKNFEAIFEEMLVDKGLVAKQDPISLGEGKIAYPTCSGKGEIRVKKNFFLWTHSHVEQCPTCKGSRKIKA